ncbi:MAG TPA: hypothetical protein VFO20_14825 [Propionibacteriaceae bacterium]|nr:hypothetical protein [Propionibacteriaceae bacterium]
MNGASRPGTSVLRGLHVAAEVEAEPQKKVYDEWGNFVARADLWVVGTRRVHEYDGEAHRDEERHRADLRRKRRLVEIDWQRIGFTSPQLLYEAASIIAEIVGCWAGPGIHDVWRDGRPCSTSRFSGLAVAPEQSVAGDGLSKTGGKVAASCGFDAGGAPICQHFRGPGREAPAVRRRRG